MFFQAINQMITTGTDLNINIRQVNNNLTVAVIPRRNGAKRRAGKHRSADLERHAGRAGWASCRRSAHRTEGAGHPYQPGNVRETGGTGVHHKAKQPSLLAEKESKEVREKREKMEKLLKKAEDATDRQTLFRSVDMAQAGKSAGTSGQAKGD